jgi:hypothetical protein
MNIYESLLQLFMKVWILKEAKGLKFYPSLKANKDFDEDDVHDEIEEDFNENDEKKQCIKEKKIPIKLKLFVQVMFLNFAKLWKHLGLQVFCFMVLKAF